MRLCALGRKYVQQIQKLIQFKFVQDSFHVLGSHVVLGLSGIIANIIVGNGYGAQGLGVFNQALTIFSIASLLAVFGLNHSVVKHIAQYTDQWDIQQRIVSSASMLAFLISLLITGSLIYITVHFPSLYFSEQVTNATVIMLLSLPFFIQNKILMSLANGLRQMKTYAMVQSARWILIIGFIIFSNTTGKSIYFLSFAFLFSESLIFLFLIVLYGRFFTFSGVHAWHRIHITFGSKSLLLGFGNEVNTRMDIFFISFFLTSTHVGIYSFASSFIKGLLMLASAVQLNVNPIASALWSINDIASLKKYTRKISKAMIVSVAPLVMLLALGFPVFVHVFMNDQIYWQSLPVFYILLVGALLKAVFSFAGSYLTMAGFLNTALLNMVIVLLYTAMSCLFFIQLFGFIGAALSTATTYVLSVFLWQYFISKKMGVNLIGRFNSNEVLG